MFYSKHHFVFVQLQMADGGLEAYFNPTYVEGAYFNQTYVEEVDTSFSPCSVTIPGFNTWGLTATYMVVFLLGTVGNSVVVLVLCCMKKGRGSTDVYIMHLALADFLFSLTLPFWAVDATSGWIFGTALCKTMSGFQEASLYSSVFLLACISVDRHLAIVKATSVLLSRHMLVKVLCTLAWLGSGLLSLPAVLKKQSVEAEELGRSICYEKLDGEHGERWLVVLLVLRHTFGFFLPMGVMAVCYTWTVVTLLRNRSQQKQKAIHVILAVVVAFVVCWLPYNVGVLVDSLIRGRWLEVESCVMLHGLETFLSVTQVLAFVHCALNPVLYAFVGQKFRKQLSLTLYDRGLIRRGYRSSSRSRGSVNSGGSSRSRNTSVNV